MKKISLTLLLTLIVSASNVFAQKSHSSERFGHTLNLGLGLGGYYGYYNYGQSLPIFNINYELDVAKNFTLAPFVSFSTYRNDSKYYRETIIPIGVKGTYYFDQLLGAGPNWDFYLAGSLGFSIVKETWDNGYSRDTYYHNVDPLFLDLHAGAEYHLSKKVGLFLDLSTGVSTLGLSFR